MSHGCLFAYMFAHNAHIRVLRKKEKKNAHKLCVYIIEMHLQYAMCIVYLSLLTMFRRPMYYDVCRFYTQRCQNESTF